MGQICYVKPFCEEAIGFMFLQLKYRIHIKVDDITWQLSLENDKRTFDVESVFQFQESMAFCAFPIPPDTLYLAGPPRTFSNISVISAMYLN